MRGAKCAMPDIKYFYLNTPMKRYEYMRIKITDIPEEIIKEYKLCEIVTQDGYIYCKIQKGMYCLPQAGIVYQELLQERLAKVGYHQSKIIPRLWTHKTRKICFTLVVDDFAIKYTKLEDAQHLINALKKDYTITVDWDATKYIGLTIEWDYAKGKVHVHMPGYLPKALLQFNHPQPKKKQNSPYPHVAPQYGAKIQYTSDVDNSPPLNKEETKYIQAVAETLLYYGRAVDKTILPALSAIATEQVQPTEKMKETITQLLDYCASQEEAIITYPASKMILAVHRNAGFCNKKKSRSRAGGHFFMKRCRTPHQQRSHPHNCNNHQGGNDISSQSRVRSTVYKCKRGSIPLANTHQNGSCATLNPNPNRQLDGGKGNQQQNPTQKNKKQWICAFIGYEIARPRINSEFTGGRGKPTLQITLQNSIHQHIM